MKYLKILGLVAALAGLMAFVTAGSASATILTGSSGQLGVGTIIKAESEGHVILHPPIGDIECNGTFEGEVSNAGSSTTTVSGPVKSLGFPGCTNANVVVLKSGTLEIHTRTATADNNGTLTSNGGEVTVEFSGFHCIFSTSNTDIGTVTGSANTTSGHATLDIEATISRTGGRSGAFCGSTAQWTGFYTVTQPSVLNVD